MNILGSGIGNLFLLIDSTSLCEEICFNVRVCLNGHL